MAVKFDSTRKRMCKTAVRGLKEYKDREEKILSAFQAWDLDQNGFISKDELCRVLQRVAGDADGVEEMLREADLDADGQIDYEEMVHWLLRAPYLEQYFVYSEQIFRQTWQDLIVEMKDLGRPSEGDLRLSIDFLKRSNDAHARMQEITERRIREELTPLIKKSFAYHDKDGSGRLNYEESIIFFSNFMALWEPFAEVMAEMNIVCWELSKPQQSLDPLLKEVQVMRPDQMHQAFQQKYALLKQRHFEELEKFQRQAFQLLCPDGYIEEKQIVEALLHGTKKNSDFLEAMGLRVEKSMRVSEFYDAKAAKEAVDFMEDVLKKMGK